MTTRTDEIWKSSPLVERYLEGVRGGIPMAAEQIDVMMWLVSHGGENVTRFLDMGCGDGVLGAALLAAYPEAKGVFVDFSEPMLAAARQKLSADLDRIELLQLDFAAPAWVKGVQHAAPYDVIVSGYSLHHQPNERKMAVFAEVRDLLRPGGIFINVEHVASRTPWIGLLNDELFIDCLHSAHVSEGGTKSREDVASEYYHRPDKSANILAPVESQCEWLRGLGYQDVDCYFKVFELAVFGGRRREK
jgi:SAM-dependent methyltransferase